MTYQLAQELFHARRLPTQTGYTWTLTSRLGHILRMVEDYFGSRDKSFTLLGLEFCSSGPNTWFPSNCKNVIIQLSYFASNDEKQACYQIAHECVHLLSPVTLGNENNLEEGVATYFASEYMKKFMADSSWYTTMDSYKEAERIVFKIMAEDMECVKKLRRLEPSLSKVTMEQLKTLDAVKCLSEDECNFLLERFDRDKKFN